MAGAGPQCSADDPGPQALTSLFSLESQFDHSPVWIFCGEEPCMVTGGIGVARPVKIVSLDLILGSGECFSGDRIHQAGPVNPNGHSGTTLKADAPFLLKFTPTPGPWKSNRKSWRESLQPCLFLPASVLVVGPVWVKAPGEQYAPETVPSTGRVQRRVVFIIGHKYPVILGH